jgi:pyocin large subunit-like protein
MFFLCSRLGFKEMKMAGEWKGLPWLAAISAAALLAGCDNGPSAVATKQAAGTQMASAEAPASSAAPADAAAKVDHRKDPVKLLDGKPEWAASRRYSADESAQHAYDRNGAAFGAKSLEDYVRKAHAFVEHPPKGAETLARANGDTLFYDAKANVFAVADKAGTPRTMFKPDDGAAYWQEQKDREAKRQTARAERRSHRSSDDEA